MHGNNQEGMVLYNVWSWKLLAIIEVKRCIVGCASSVFANACTALLCQLVHRLFMS